MTAKQPTTRQREYLEARAEGTVPRGTSNQARARIRNNCIERGWLTDFAVTAGQSYQVTPAGYEAIGRRGSAVAAAIIAGDDAYIDGALERVDAELDAVATVRTVPIPAAPAIGFEDAAGNPLHEGDAVDLGEPGQMYAVSHADPDGRGLWVYPLGVSLGAERQVSVTDVRKQVFANVAGVVKYVPATPTEADAEDGDGWGQPDGMLGPTEAERVEAPRTYTARELSGTGTYPQPHVVRRDDPTGPTGKIYAVYGDDDLTATRVKVLWGADADLNPHFAGDAGRDAEVADLIPAPPAPADVVAELDPWHPDRTACIAGRVFALTRGLKATPTDPRYRMRAARVGSRVVDLHSNTGDYLATIVEHGGADWRVANRERELGAYSAFAAAVQAVRTMATNGEITGSPDPYAEPPAVVADPLATLRAASDRFEAACASGVDVDDHARDLAIALGAAGRDVLAEAIAATLADGRITPATDHPVTVEGPDSAGHMSVSCTQCPASATGLEDVLEAVVSALTHGPLAAAFDFAALADQFTHELEADDLEDLTEMASVALTGPRDAHVNQAATDLVDTLKAVRPLGPPTAD